MNDKEEKQIREILELECGRVRCDSSAPFGYWLIIDWINKKKAKWIKESILNELYSKEYRQKVDKIIERN